MGVVATRLAIWGLLHARRNDVGLGGRESSQARDGQQATATMDFTAPAHRSSHKVESEK